jgi:hypothetical protein
MSAVALHRCAAALLGDERIDLEAPCYERSSSDGVSTTDDNDFADSTSAVFESRLSSDAERLLC